jgi:hypothetical protein
MYPAQRLIFIYCLFAELIRAMRGLRAPRRRSPVRPASRQARHPPQLPSARRSAPPGGSRAGATTRRARPRGAGLKSAARCGNWQASRRTERPHTVRRPSSDAKYGTDRTRRKRKSASARPRHRRAARTAPLRRAPCQGSKRAGTGGPGRFSRRIRNCSRRSAKIQKVWLSCVAR